MSPSTLSTPKSRFQLFEHLDLGPDDAAIGEDVAAYERELAHHVLPEGLEHPPLQVVDVGHDPPQDREAVVDHGVENAVQQVAGAPAHDALAYLVARLAVGEELDQRTELSRVHRHDVSGTGEDVHFARLGDPGLLVEPGKVHDHEEMVVELVQLGHLDDADAVVEAELVEPVPLAENRHLGGPGAFDVYPGQRAVLHDLDV